MHGKADRMLSDDKTETALPEGYSDLQTDLFVDIPNDLGASINDGVGKTYDTAGDLAEDTGAAVALASILALTGEALPRRPHTGSAED